MDFFNDTPAERFFQGDIFELRAPSSETAFDGASFFMDFYVAGLQLTLIAFDYQQDSETHVFHGATDEELEKFILQVETTYNVKIPNHFTNVPKWFLRGKVTGFQLEEVYLGDPADESVLIECETCNDYNTNAVTAYFFPSFRNIAPSLAVGWDYGCFDGEREAGEDTQILRGKAVELLERAFTAAAENEAAQKEVGKFLERLEGIHAV